MYDDATYAAQDKYCRPQVYLRLHPATFFSSRPGAARRADRASKFPERRRAIAIHDSPPPFFFLSSENGVYHEIRFLVTSRKYISDRFTVRHKLHQLARGICQDVTSPTQPRYLQPVDPCAEIIAKCLPVRHPPSLSKQPYHHRRPLRYRRVNGVMLTARYKFSVRSSARANTDWTDGCDMAAINVDETRPALSISPQDRRILTDRDVNEILGRKLDGVDYRLVDWRLEPFGQTVGFLGRYYRLVVNARTNGGTRSLRFFAKSPPPCDSVQYEFLQRYDTFNKEIAVYTDLMRRMGAGERPKWTVECYLCKRNVVIVLEDASIDGYVMLDKYVPFDTEHCVWLLRTISRLHSRSLILDERLRRGDGRTILDLYGHLLNEVLFVKGDDRSERTLVSSTIGLLAAIDFVPQLDDDEKIAVRRRIGEWAPMISRLLAPSREHRNVICHRDVWANNLMFRHDSAGNPDGCYIIDFQFLRYCPPAIDFTFCLYLTTDRATRDGHFDTFARIYHDSLARGLAEDGLDVEDCVPWPAFQKSCAESRNVALIYAALNMQIMLLSGEATVNYFCRATEKLEQILYGSERSDLVRHECQNVPAYRERYAEIILEIRDRLPEHPPSNL